MRKKQKSRFVMKSLLHYENESTYGWIMYREFACSANEISEWSSMSYWDACCGCGAHCIGHVHTNTDTLMAPCLNRVHIRRHSPHIHKLQFNLNGNESSQIAQVIQLSWAICGRGIDNEIAAACQPWYSADWPRRCADAAAAGVQPPLSSSSASPLLVHVLFICAHCNHGPFSCMCSSYEIRCVLCWCGTWPARCMTVQVKFRFL